VGVDLVSLLIEYGANGNAGFSTLYQACLVGNLEIVKMVSSVCNINLVTKGIIDGFDMIRPIEIAAKNGYVQIVEYLVIKLGSPLYDSLYYAVSKGWMDVVNYLLEILKNNNMEIDLSMCDKNPLLAACEGNVDMVDRILQENVNLSTINKLGYSYIVQAMTCGNLDIVKRLVNYGDNIYYVNEQMSTILHEACEYRHAIDTVEFLIGFGFNLNCVDMWGRTPLMIACLYWNNAAIQLLLKSNANVEIIDEDGKTARDHAKYSCLDLLDQHVKQKIE
jgi:uncharacterized protein